MTDRELIEAYETCTLDPDLFHHRQHVRVAWICLREAPLVAALTRFVESLRRFATSAGSPGLYHETITFAFVFLIHQRMQTHSKETFEEFAAANADLFSWKPSVLDRYYTPETLGSELARRTFVMPDRPGVGSADAIPSRPDQHRLDEGAARLAGDGRLHVAAR